MFSISIYYKQILLYNLCIRDPSLERRCSMTTSVLEKSLSYDDLIASLRLIDDDFMRIIFKNQDCIQLLLDIILDEHVEIIENDSQYDLKNLLGRSLTIDVLVKDNRGHYINIEVQRDEADAHPKRARYHQSLIDSFLSFPNEKWREIPKTIVIFITEEDVLGYDLPIYHVRRRIVENGESFDDETEIIYVNASIQDDSELGRLMHDFMCKEVESMNYEVLKKQVGYYKESEGGKREMCEIWQKIRDEGYMEGEKYGEIKGYAEGEMNKTIEFIKKLITKHSYTIDEVMDLLDIPESQHQQYIEKILS